MSNQTGRLITVYKNDHGRGTRIGIKTGHHSAKTPWKFKSMAVRGQ